MRLAAIEALLNCFYLLTLLILLLFESQPIKVKNKIKYYI